MAGKTMRAKRRGKWDDERAERLARLEREKLRKRREKADLRNYGFREGAQVEVRERFFPGKNQGRVEFTTAEGVIERVFSRFLLIRGRNYRLTVPVWDIFTGRVRLVS